MLKREENDDQKLQAEQLGNMEYGKHHSSEDQSIDRPFAQSTVLSQEQKSSNSAASARESGRIEGSSMAVIRGSSTLQSESLSLESYNLFTKKALVVRLVSDLAVLMTFGVLFPPLGLIIVFSMCVEMLCSQIIIGRLFTLASTTRPDLRQLAAVINHEFRDVGQVLWSSINKVIPVLAALFWSYSLFDTLGSAVKAVNAIWIVVVMATSPFWLHYDGLGLLVVRTWLRSRFQGERNHSVADFDNDTDADELRRRVTAANGAASVDVKNPIRLSQVELSHSFSSTAAAWQTRDTFS